MEKALGQITPFLVEKPWGGDYLSEFFHSKQTKLGEAWLLSTLAGGESQVGGQDLSAALGTKLPFLIKIIDAAEALSVQVHPDDKWAAELENSKGKTECWLILSAKPGAGVYLGLKDSVDSYTFSEALRGGRAVDKFLKFHRVVAGDFIFVPAGTVHAIGEGVTLLEVQQASGITYRLWDWDRPAREMHVEKGLKVMNYHPAYDLRHGLFASGKKGLLLKHADFECHLNEAPGTGWFVDLKTYSVFKGDASAAPAEPYIFVK
jgi:mannose-6-phosphate isomerase